MQHLICLIANQNTFPARATAPTHAGEVLMCIKFPWCLSGLDKLVVFAATYSNNIKTTISNGGATRTRWVGYHILKDFAVFPSSRRYGLPGYMHSYPIHGRYFTKLTRLPMRTIGTNAYALVKYTAEIIVLHTAASPKYQCMS